MVGGVVAPTLLPSGILRAGNSSHQKVKHVVFCLFAGGIRNFESLDKAEGNLMPYTLPGKESISQDILQGIELMPTPAGGTLSELGTMFSGFRYESDETIHYSAHAVAITGNYRGNFQIMKPLSVPTVFEYYRKHKDDTGSALNAWWVTDQAGPFPYLNYSNHPDYGPLYGANMIHPLSLFGVEYDELNFFSNESLEHIRQLKSLLGRQGVNVPEVGYRAGILNSDEERYRIERFIYKMGRDVFSQHEYNFWGLGNRANEDIITMFTACSILQEFKPELLVVNMQHTDIGHSNFTQMCNNLQKADFALYKLWETIQQTPGMKDNTVLIAAPEFGRNIKNNTIYDQYGRAAVDHTGDENSKKIFCLVLGPPNLVRQGQWIDAIQGETIDIVPTIADLLGFRHKMPLGFLDGRVLKEAFYV